MRLNRRKARLPGLHVRQPGKAGNYKESENAMNEGQDDIVRKLEEVLVRARAGEFKAIAFVAQCANMNTASVFDIGPEGEVATVLGAVEQLKHRILDEQRE